MKKNEKKIKTISTILLSKFRENILNISTLIFLILIKNCSEFVYCSEIVIYKHAESRKGNILALKRS